MKRLVLLTAILGLFSLSAIAQGSRTVKGYVQDANAQALPGAVVKAVSESASTKAGSDGAFELEVTSYCKFVEASFEGYITSQAEIDGSIIIFRLNIDKKYAKNKAKAEKAARIAAEQEAARLAAQQEAARIAAQQEAARLAAQQEAARIAAEKAKVEEAARIAAQQEAARLAAQQEAARIAAEKAKAEEAARIAVQQEAARLVAQQEAARIAAEKAKAEEAARLAAEKAKAEEAARIAAQKEAERIAAEKIKAAEEARLEAEKARIAAEKALAEERARMAAEKAQLEEQIRLAVEKAIAEERTRLAAQTNSVQPTQQVAVQPQKVAQQPIQQPIQQQIAQQSTAVVRNQAITSVPNDEDQVPLEKKAKKPVKKNRFGQAIEFGYLATTKSINDIEGFDSAATLYYALGGSFCNNLIFFGVGTGVIWNFGYSRPEYVTSDNVNTSEYYPYEDIGALNLSYISIPVYLYLKVNMAKDAKVAPFFSLMGGSEIDPISNVQSFRYGRQLENFYQTTIFGRASLGLNFRLGNKTSMYIGVGYHLDSRWGGETISGNPDILPIRCNIHGITANLGFTF